MPKYVNRLSIGIAFAVLVGCRSKTETLTCSNRESAGSAQYSAIVKDSFYVQTQLPAEYNDSTAKRYPVVVILDANFHFPMLAASVRQYEKGGYSRP